MTIYAFNVTKIPVSIFFIIKAYEKLLKTFISMNDFTLLYLNNMYR